MTNTVLFSSSAGDINADLAFINMLDPDTTTDPGVNDDATLGYSVGSVWVNPAGPRVWTCTDASEGAAQWSAAAQQDASGNQVITGSLYVETLIARNQAAPVAKTTSSTLTAANLLVGMVTVNQGGGANSDQQLPTGTTLQNALGALFVTDMSFDFSVINTGTTDETATLTVNTNVTIVGNAVVEPGASATFRARKTAANTFVVYRIAG